MTTQKDEQPECTCPDFNSFGHEPGCPWLEWRGLRRAEEERGKQDGQTVAGTPGFKADSVRSTDWLAAMQLLMESRECIAACFRAMAASSDPMEMDRLQMQLALAGVRDGIGVRLQEFIAANDGDQLR